MSKRTGKEKGDRSLANQPSTKPWPEFVGGMLINLPIEIRDWTKIHFPAPAMAELIRAVYNAQITRKQFREILQAFMEQRIALPKSDDITSSAKPESPPEASSP